MKVIDKSKIKRNWCLCEGEYHCIDEIYYIKNEKQINIPEQLEKFRKWSRAGKLLCECGCGAKLMLVAGSKSVRRQHFRAYPDQEELLQGCTAREENEITQLSRIYLRDWLNHVWELQSGEVKHGITVNSVSDVKRKYRYTHYVEKYNFGICYEHYDANLDDDKISTLYQQEKTKLLYVVDISNSSYSGQYPEHLMKIQKHQGYCFFIDIANAEDFSQAYVEIVSYQKNFEEIWEGVLIEAGNIVDFSLDKNGELLWRGQTVIQMAADAIIEFEEEQRKLKVEEKERIQQERELEELEEQELEEDEELEELEEDEEEQYEIEQPVSEIKVVEPIVNQKPKSILVADVMEERKNREKKEQILLDYLCEHSLLEGSFIARGDSGKMEEHKERIRNYSAHIYTEDKRIVIRGEDFKVYYIYLLKTATDAILMHMDRNPHTFFPLYWFREEDIINQFEERFKCTKQDKYKQQSLLNTEEKSAWWERL